MKKASIKLNVLVKELEERYERWNYIKNNGTEDPNWEDGFSMNLVRNHIIYTKQKIQALCSEYSFNTPDIYYRELPPKVDNKYMAKADIIRKAAIESLKAYENDSNFKELKSVYNYIRNKDKKEIAGNILGYKKGLKHFIETNDYAGMRRHMNTKRYLDSAKQFVESLTKEDYEGQVSFFDYV